MRRVYTDGDRARILVVLKTNDGNVARTARDTGVPEATVRDWKQEWEANGIPSTLIEVAQVQAEDIVADMERVRYKALQLLEARLPESRDVKALATVFGIVDDKIRLARGLATSRTVTEHELPSPEKMSEMFQAIVKGALVAQSERASDIEDIVIEVEQAPKKALNKGAFK